MSESHVNTDRLGKGQELGAAHPENPFSEHKYPPFFRLFNRGDEEKTAPLDLDDDYFLVKNHDKFVQFAKQQQQAELKQAQEQGLVTTASTDSVDFEKYHEALPDKFSVASEAKYDSATLSFLSRVLHGAREAASKYGLRDLSAQDLAKLNDVQAQYQKAVAENNESLSQSLAAEYATLRRRGATQENFAKYQAEVVAISNSLSPAYANKVELSITPDVFRTISGAHGLREGGWYDGDFFSEAQKKHWTQNGLVIQVPKNQLNNLGMSTIFGSDLGKKLDTVYAKYQQYALDLKSKKIGAKFALGVYGGLVLWTIWFKWIQINEREYFRQKSKFALRVMNDEDILTKQQEAVLAKHKQWASKYYEEDEEEEQAAEEEAADE